MRQRTFSSVGFEIHGKQTRRGTVTLTGLRHEGVVSNPAGHAASITQEISCHATIAAERSVR